VFAYFYTIKEELFITALILNVSNTFRLLVCLTLFVAIEEEAGWAPELFWMVWRSEVFLALPGTKPR